MKLMTHVPIIDDLCRSPVEVTGNSLTGRRPAVKSAQIVVAQALLITASLYFLLGGCTATSESGSLATVSGS